MSDPDFRWNYPNELDQNRMYQNRGSRGSYRHPCNELGGSLSRPSTQPRPPNLSTRASCQTTNPRAPVDMIRLQSFSGHIVIHPDLEEPTTTEHYGPDSSNVAIDPSNTVAQRLSENFLQSPMTTAHYHPHSSTGGLRDPNIDPCDILSNGSGASSEQNVRQMIASLVENIPSFCNPRNLEPRVPHSRLPHSHLPHSLPGAHNPQSSAPHDPWDSWMTMTPQYESQALYDHSVSSPVSEFDDLPFRPRNTDMPARRMTAIGLREPHVGSKMFEASQYIAAQQPQAALSSALVPMPYSHINQMPSTGSQERPDFSYFDQRDQQMFGPSAYPSGILSRPQQHQLGASAPLLLTQPPSSYPLNDAQQLNPSLGPLAFASDAPAHIEQHDSSAFTAWPPSQPYANYVPLSQQLNPSIGLNAYASNVPPPALQQEQPDFIAQAPAQPSASHFQPNNAQLGPPFGSFAHATNVLAGTQRLGPVPLAAQTPIQPPTMYFYPGNQRLHPLPGPPNQTQRVESGTRQQQPSSYAAPNADTFRQGPQRPFPMLPALAASLHPQYQISSQGSAQHQQPSFSTSSQANELPSNDQQDHPLSGPISRTLGHQSCARQPRPGSSSSSSSSTATIIAAPQPSGSRVTPSDLGTGNNARASSSPEAASTPSSSTSKEANRKKGKCKWNREVLFCAGGSYHGPKA